MSAAPATPIAAGIELSLHIGQRVRHSDYKGHRVTGVVRSLSIEHDQGLMVTIALDAPIVIPAGHGYGPTRIHNQHAPAHEFSPFDERDEQLLDLLTALREAEAGLEFAGADQLAATGDFVPAPLLALRAVRAAIAKATGGAQ
jgi:hypothetical protein